jgi:Cu(I)/Ag(I) efflux system membrane protein CusA/SilA
MSSSAHQKDWVSQIIRASGRNPALVILLTILAGAAGWVALRQVPLDALPDLSDTQVVVTTDWPGSSADLIEDQITFPLQSRFLGAPRIKAVRGESVYGRSFLYIIFNEGTDLYWARTRVGEVLSSARAVLPANADPKMGPDANGLGWIYQYALTDSSGKQNLGQLRTLQDWVLRPALASVPGVAEVAPLGGFVREIQVQLDPDRLSSSGVTLAEVADAVRKSNRDASGRSLEVNSAEVIVRGRGRLHSPDELKQLTLRNSRAGSPLLLGDVATIVEGGAPRIGVAELNGQGETVGGIVIMRDRENALRVISGIKEKLKQVKTALPAGLEIVTVYDRSDLILRAIHNLQSKLLEEGFVVAIVCLLFLGHVRSSLVALLTLPLALLLSFLPFSLLGLSANIMSLGGMAIAIGAMVDAAIVLVENAHKRLEESGPLDFVARREVILDAACSVGRPLFFSLLVITVSFLPVFALTGQEGRLFHPLASTKTFAMAFAAILSITLVPVLLPFCLSGKLRPESANPLNRFLSKLYHRPLDFVLQHRTGVLALSLLLLASTIFPMLKMGTEFMPPLNEGDILYMPTAAPGLSTPEASRLLTLQNKKIREFPEVLSVMGKAGAAETATDPAPLSMFETVVRLKPREEWRPGLSWDSLVAEMDAATQTPGMANVFWMPIQTRTQMLSTGFRSNLGIKLHAPNPQILDQVGAEMERALTSFPGTRGVFAERFTGGRYLDLDFDREKLSRQGLSVEDAASALESAIAGETVTEWIDGRSRFPVTVRYARDFRQDPEDLARVLIPLPNGGNVPFSQIARITSREGPTSLRSENGQLLSYITVDSTAGDVTGYVAKADRYLKEKVQFPPGTWFEWGGTFESIQRARQTFALAIPATLALIMTLLLLNTRSISRTALIMLAVPFSLVGAFWLPWLLGHHFSVASAVGLIALAGLDAETGVVMLLYLDHAVDERRAKNQLRNRADLFAAIHQGAVGRLRPKVMTMFTIVAGLMPIFFGHGTGSDVMQRIAAPMLGGVITSTLLELLLYPVLYTLWFGRNLPKT